jgi:hypothetical protein
MVHRISLGQQQGARGQILLFSVAAGWQRWPFIFVFNT